MDFRSRSPTPRGPAPTLLPRQPRQPARPPQPGPQHPVAELTEFMMGRQPEPDGPTRAPRWSVAGAEAAGLTVTGLREFRGRMEFGDIAAVVHFLRKVIWIVPGFTAAAYRGRLRALHERIEAGGPFEATSVRFLIEARKDGNVPSASG